MTSLTHQYSCSVYFLAITESSQSTALSCELPQNIEALNITGLSCISQHTLQMTAATEKKKKKHKTVGLTSLSDIHKL